MAKVWDYDAAAIAANPDPHLEKMADLAEVQAWGEVQFLSRIGGGLDPALMQHLHVAALERAVIKAKQRKVKR